MFIPKAAGQPFHSSPPSFLSSLSFFITNANTRLLPWLALTGVTITVSDSSAYTDSTTSIDFHRWCDEHKGPCFRISLPETVDRGFHRTTDRLADRRQGLERGQFIGINDPVIVNRRMAEREQWNGQFVRRPPAQIRRNTLMRVLLRSSMVQQ